MNKYFKFTIRGFRLRSWWEDRVGTKIHEEEKEGLGDRKEMRNGEVIEKRRMMGDLSLLACLFIMRWLLSCRWDGNSCSPVTAETREMLDIKKKKRLIPTRLCVCLFLNSFPLAVQQTHFWFVILMRKDISRIKTAGKKNIPTGNSFLFFLRFFFSLISLFRRHLEYFSTRKIHTGDTECHYPFWLKLDLSLKLYQACSIFNATKIKKNNLGSIYTSHNTNSKIIEIKLSSIKGVYVLLYHFPLTELFWHVLNYRVVARQVTGFSIILLKHAWILTMPSQMFKPVFFDTLSCRILKFRCVNESDSNVCQRATNLNQVCLSRDSSKTWGIVGSWRPGLK